jgi:hypothetical protein
MFFNKIFKSVSLSLFSIFFLFILSLNAIAQLNPLNQDELKECAGQSGLATFTMSNNTARIFLDVHIETFTLIDQLNLGYSSSVNKWCEKWDLVAIGTPDSPLKIDGLLCDVSFDSNHNLQQIVIGSNYLNGLIGVTPLSFTGCINPKILIPGGDPLDILPTLPPAGVSYTPLPPAILTFISNSSRNEGLFFIFNMTGSVPTVQACVGYSEAILTSGPSSWWKAP